MWTIFLGVTNDIDYIVDHSGLYTDIVLLSGSFRFIIEVFILYGLIVGTSHRSARIFGIRFRTNVEMKIRLIVSDTNLLI